ncbi:MAG TPA: NAD(P)-binding domain-containing protein, partial [Acidimicrobiales bacterium]
MKIGMVGLGKMGANMTERLLKAGHEVVAFDLSAAARDAVAAKGAEPATSLEDLAAKLTAPRAAWVMVPSGAPTDSTIAELADHFESGDVIVDGGNSNYKEAAPTAAKLAEKGIGFVDAGTSGGVWGLTEGYCLMVGGTD